MNNFRKYQELDGYINEVGLYIEPLRALTNEISEMHFKERDDAVILYTHKKAEPLNTAQLILFAGLVDKFNDLTNKYNQLFNELREEHEARK